MRWEEIRETYPDDWVIIEALKAYSNDSERIVEEVAIIEKCKDSIDAIRKYAELHKRHPQREYYFLHTSRKDLTFMERKRGLRRV